jgi:hypothetical protein
MWLLVLWHGSAKHQGSWVLLSARNFEKFVRCLEWPHFWGHPARVPRMDGSFNMGYWGWWRILSEMSVIDLESMR